MDAPELGLRIGDALLLQPLIGAANIRYRATLIGEIEGRSLLVSAPEDSRGPLDLREGEQFAVRSFVGDRALAFTCHVLRVCSQPSRYLHLSYPRRLESVVVRRSRRLDLTRPAQLAAVRSERPGPAAAPVPVTVINLSTTGALVAGPDGIAALDQPVRLDTTFDYDGLAPLPIRLDGVIRNLKPEPVGDTLRMQYGIEFGGAMETTTQLALRAFVLERLLAEARG